MSTVQSQFEEKRLSNLERKEARKLTLVEIFNESGASHFRFMLPSEIETLESKHRILFNADLESESDLHFQSAQDKAGQSEADAFLKTIENALNSGGKPVEHEPEATGSRISSVSSYAMDAATDAFFDLMEQNIDRWTYDASSNLLSSVGMRGSDDVTAQRRHAADIQVKSNKFNSEFRAFFIESLVNFKCEQATGAHSAQKVLELVGSDVWKSHDIEPILAKEYDGETRVEFSQLNHRQGLILDRKLDPEENVLGPTAIARTLAQAINECGYSTSQRAALDPIIISDFNDALRRLYHQINQIWIDLDILPDAKLDIVNTDVA